MISVPLNHPDGQKNPDRIEQTTPGNDSWCDAIRGTIRTLGSLVLAGTLLLGAGDVAHADEKDKTRPPGKEKRENPYTKMARQVKKIRQQQQVLRYHIKSLGSQLTKSDLDQLKSLEETISSQLSSLESIEQGLYDSLIYDRVPKKEQEAFDSLSAAIRELQTFLVEVHNRPHPSGEKSPIPTPSKESRTPEKPQKTPEQIRTEKAAEKKAADIKKSKEELDDIKQNLEEKKKEILSSQKPKKTGSNQVFLDPNDRPKEISISPDESPQHEILRASGCGDYFAQIIAHKIDFSNKIVPQFLPEDYQELELLNYQRVTVTTKTVRTGERLVVPSTRYIVGFKTDKKCDVKIFYDANNGQYKVETSESPVELTLFCDKGRPQHTFTNEDKKYRESLKKYIPQEYLKELDLIKELSSAERQFALKKIFKNFSYTLNPKLAKKYQENTKKGVSYLESFWKHKAGDCDVLSAVYYLFARYVGLKVKVMFGYADVKNPKGVITAHEAHGWIYDYGTGQDIEVTSLVSQSPLSGAEDAASEEELEKEIQYFEKAAQHHEKANVLENIILPEARQYMQLNDRHKKEEARFKAILMDTTQDASQTIHQLISDINRISLFDYCDTIELIADIQHSFEVIQLLLDSPLVSTSKKELIEQRRSILFADVLKIAEEKPLYLPWDNYNDQFYFGQGFEQIGGKIIDRLSGKVLCSIIPEVKLYKIENGFVQFIHKDYTEVRYGDELQFKIMRHGSKKYSLHPDSKGNLPPELTNKVFRTVTVEIENGMYVQSYRGYGENDGRGPGDHLKVYILQDDQYYASITHSGSGAKMLQTFYTNVSNPDTPNDWMGGDKKTEQVTGLRIFYNIRSGRYEISHDDGGGKFSRGKKYFNMPHEGLNNGVWTSVRYHPLSEDGGEGFYKATDKEALTRYFGEMVPEALKKPTRKTFDATQYQKNRYVIYQFDKPHPVYFIPNAPASYDATEKVDQVFFNRANPRCDAFVYSVRKGKNWFLRGDVPESFKNFPCKTQPTKIFKHPETGKMIAFVMTHDHMVAILGDPRYKNTRFRATRTEYQYAGGRYGFLGVEGRKTFLGGDFDDGKNEWTENGGLFLDENGAPFIAFSDDGQKSRMIGDLPSWFPEGEFDAITASGLSYRYGLIEKRMKEREVTRRLSLHSFNEGKSPVALEENDNEGEVSYQLHLAPVFPASFATLKPAHIGAIRKGGPGKFQITIQTEEQGTKGLKFYLPERLVKRYELCTPNALALLKDNEDKIRHLEAAFDKKKIEYSAEIQQSLIDLLTDHFISFVHRNQVIDLLKKHWWSCGEEVMEKLSPAFQKKYYKALAEDREFLVKILEKVKADAHFPKVFEELAPFLKQSTSRSIDNLWLSTGIEYPLDRYQDISKELVKATLTFVSEELGNNKDVETYLSLSELWTKLEKKYPRDKKDSGSFGWRAISIAETLEKKYLDTAETFPSPLDFRKSSWGKALPAFEAMVNVFPKEHPIHTMLQKTRKFMELMKDYSEEDGYELTPRRFDHRCEEIQKFLNTPEWFRWSSDYEDPSDQRTIREFQRFALAEIGIEQADLILRMDDAITKVRQQFPEFRGKKNILEFQDIQLALRKIKEHHGLGDDFSIEHSQASLSNQIVIALKESADHLKFANGDKLWRRIDGEVLEILHRQLGEREGIQVGLGELLKEVFNNWLLDILIIILMGVIARAGLSNHFRKRGGYLNANNAQQLLEEIWSDASSAQALNSRKKLLELYTELEKGGDSNNNAERIIQDLLFQSQDMTTEEKRQLALSLRIPFSSEEVMIGGIKELFSLLTDKRYLAQQKTLRNLSSLAHESKHQKSFSDQLDEVFAAQTQSLEPEQKQKSNEHMLGRALGNVRHHLFRYLNYQQSNPLRSYTPLLMKIPFGIQEGDEIETRSPYIQGDDIKYIDWPLFGRTNKYYMKRFERYEGRPVAIVLNVPALLRQAESQREFAEALYVMLKKQIPLGEVVLVSSGDHMKHVNVANMIRGGKLHSVSKVSEFLQRIHTEMKNFTKQKNYQSDPVGFPEQDWYRGDDLLAYQQLWEASVSILGTSQEWTPEQLETFVRKGLRKILKRKPSVCAIGFNNSRKVFEKEFGKGRVWMGQ